MLSLFAVLLAYAISYMSLARIDLFFLDWRQILLNDVPPKSPFISLRISDLKDVLDEELGSGFSEKRLLNILDEAVKAKPRAIIFAVSPGEIISHRAKEILDLIASKYPELYLYIDQINRTPFSYYGVPAYKDFPRKIALLLTNDSSIDRVSRRILLYYDFEKKKPNFDFENIPKTLGVSVNSPDKFDGTFFYYDSIQMNMKIWDISKLPHVSPRDMNQLQAYASELKDKVVVIGTTDTFGMLSSPSITHRRDLFSAPTVRNSYWSDADLIVTYLINLYSGEHIAKASESIKTLWLGFWFLCIFCVLVYCDLFKGIPLSFAVILFFSGIATLVFKAYSFDLDIGRGILGSVLIQYFGIPVLLMRYLRKMDGEKLRIEKQREIDRVKSRFVVRAAKADLSLQIAARVSHDIRSPLTALQVAQSVIKGKVSEDVESLIRESVARIKFIADDILDSYRKGKSDPNRVLRTALRDLVEELFQSYRQLYPHVNFRNQISNGLLTYIPSYGLQRCFSNLLNNSIEAMPPDGQAEIVISATEIDDRMEIYVIDNGRGVSDEIVNRLFKERATHGKKSGTGLGLFQVRKELEIYSGSISYRPNSDSGSCFVISIPNTISGIPLKVFPRIMVVESADEIYSALKDRVHDDISIFHCGSVKEVMRYINEDSNAPWTLFVDIALSDEESGFDIVESLGANFAGQAILCSTFVDNIEIQEIASRYNAILLNKDLLYRIDISY